MNKTIDPNRRISSLSDIARTLGLRAGSEKSLIARQFERRTNYSASLEIEETAVVLRQDEVWEVRICRASPHCRISLRPGSRGEWITDMRDIPAEVRAFFMLKEIKGELVTTRSWKSWSRANWVKAGGRQLRSRQEEIQAIACIEGVQRDTGDRKMALRVNPLIDEDREDTALRLNLPCRARSLLDVVDQCRMAGMSIAA